MSVSTIILIILIFIIGVVVSLFIGYKKGFTDAGKVFRNLINRTIDSLKTDSEKNIDNNETK